MSKARHFLLLFWKNWTLGRRAPVRSFFEICFPLFYIVLLVLLRAFLIKDHQKEQSNYPQFQVNKLPKGLIEKSWNFGYSPNTSDVQTVMQNVAKNLGFKMDSYSGFKTEDEMVTFLVNAAAMNSFLGGVYFETTPNNSFVNYKIRLSSRARNSKKSKFRKFGGDPTTAWNTQFTFPVFQVPGPRSPNATHGGPPEYYDEGFLAIQHAIDKSILEYKGVDIFNNLTIGLRRYPYPAYLDDPFILVIQQTLPLLLMLSLVVTALYIVKDIVHEKERKLKESLKMMGLSGWLHWLAWFTKYFIFILFTVIIASILFTTKFNSNGKILNKSDPSVIFVFLLLFAVSSIMFCFLVSVFFSKANIAAAAGGIIWFCSYIPYFFVSQNYDNMSIGLKLLSCILSNCAMGMGSLLIGKFEGRGTGVQWSNINEGVSVDDTMTLGLVMWMMVGDCLLYGVITWYIEAVFPGEYGTPQRWYFPCLPSYWCGKNRPDGDNDFHNGHLPNASTEFLEKEPSRLHAGVVINSLKKVFSENGKKVAVDGVSLNMYEGQITALLGHNGAGKTTLMSMLTGLFPPTSGNAVVNGCSITDDISGVRSSLGLCPQHDVLFDRLTVEEHLWMFGLLKGCTLKGVMREVDSMITRVGLVDKRHTQTRALSGGMKRKLSVGIALIGNSKVVMLDEPTSGMDPSARRFTWELLQQERQHRTILLTTHFMDEADLLGDRIAIMAEGHIKCCGSSLFLKNKYGVGYHMAVVKGPSCNAGKVTEVVQKFVPTAQLESNVGAELSYILPSEATGRFEELFTELETRGTELGIMSFGASVTTMEEVFLKVGEEMDDSITKILQNQDGDEPREQEPVSDDVLEHQIDIKDTNNLGIFSGASGLHSTSRRNGGLQLAIQRWYAMFVKKFLHSRRHKLSIISQLLLPLVFTLMALINAKTFPQPEDSPALHLNVSDFGKNVVLYKGPTDKWSSAMMYARSYKDQFIGSEAKTVLVRDNMSDFIIAEGKRIGLGTFNLHHLVAASFTQEDASLVNVTAWFNNQALHSTAVALAAVHNGLLQNALGRNHSISTTNHPLPRTTKDTIDDLSRNGVGFLISFNMLFGMAFLASSFVVFLVQERTNKAKHVQFVSGVTPIGYWTSAYLWDMINFLIPTLSLIILLAAFDVPAYQGPRLGYTFVLLMIYGWAVIPLMYIFSFVFRTAANAFVILTVFNIITGLATLLTVFILSIPGLDLLDVADALKWAFLVLPNYCLGQGIGDIFSNYDSLTIFNEAVDACVKELGPTFRNICIKTIEQLAGSRLQFQDNYLAWDNPGIGRYLIFMSLEGLVFFLVVLVIEYGVFRRLLLVCRRGCEAKDPQIELNSSTCTVEDDDVFEEKKRVAAGNTRGDVLILDELTKVFREKIGGASLLAVDHLSLGVPMGECFGLLGINGAGKTTTFRMLTGDETMTSGTATVDNYDIRRNMNQVRQRIGYCPQFDALIDQMTGREVLYMYARLRGVPEQDIPGAIEELVVSLLLTGQVDKLTKNLSGGNKRKLSTAIALVGDPPVVFLDEPTTGMDPVARRLLWDALSRVRAEGRCIIITSHSMEECDALCTRLAIMVNGRFKCLGSPQHLKTKFGEGFTLLAKVGGMPPDTGPLKEFIEGSFPGSILKDEHLGMVNYHITDTSVTWAQVFGTIERNKLEYDIEDYSVSQTTLEQVFLNFARGQRQEDE
ncbi:phospholipid-transporting ATPase ABCA3-like isoform X2 [Nematostella vectensis]|uniref:phospholipid-transporting ATPase ABCA3-like isoform X2 n=1 Tax=Nematostella vectensis TaxID=45351 RepID=UPI00207709F9|nr:phospholipid-transporting ATPase ABCA3-like isoform X2 [Nematostella vectensis]